MVTEEKRGLYPGPASLAAANPGRCQGKAYGVWVDNRNTTLVVPPGKGAVGGSASSGLLSSLSEDP